MAKQAEETDPQTAAAALAGLSVESLLHDRYDGRDSRDIFAKVREFKLAEQARAAHLYVFFQPLDRNDGAEAEIYGPRLLNGTTHLHEALEDRIAEFLGAEAALVFTTGYQTNLGVISSLVNRRSVAVVDKADHASIYDGCRLAEGEMLRFRHNDAQHLDTILGRIGADKAPLVVIDGVFSMGGDIADLPAIVEVCQRRQARLLVDDAHAIGVIGKGGRGTASHFGLEGTVDLTVGTFSKSF